MRRCPTCGLDFDSPKARASHERGHARTVAERLYSRVDRDGPVPAHRPDLGACWVWLGHTVDGYGRMVVDGVARGAHRIALALHLGRELQDGMDACHHCDYPPCVNPAHLFEGTQLENIADRDAKGRAARGDTNGRARLTADDVRAIRSRIARGASRAQAAAEFGVSKGSVSAIAEGRTWSHVS